MPDTPPPQTDLRTWKEIADYLGVSVRQAQKWEMNDRMPVRRMPGKKSRVEAHPAALDAWKAQAATTRGAPPGVSGGEAELAADAREAKGTGSEAAPRSLSRRKALAGLAGVATAAAAGGLWLFRRNSLLPMRAGVLGNTLCAWDERGREVWKHPFPRLLRDRKGDRGMMRVPERQVQVVDLHDDGARQVLFAAAFAEEDGKPARDVLYCFSLAEGRLLWEYSPSIAVTFGDARFSGPWCFSDMAFSGSGRRRALWLAVAHLNWLPGAVLTIDAEGREELKFVNAGHIYALRRASHHGRNYVMAGGVNNEYASAALAVLDEEAAPSGSPQGRDRRFECVDGPKGQPDRYFLFPPSELTIASDKPYNMVTTIEAAGREFTVGTSEVPEEQAGAIYRISNGIEPLEVGFDDSWAARHRRLQAQGRLNHNLRDCPQLKHPAPVRRWEPKSGWVTLAVPPSHSIKPDGYQG